jgi:hypothetical protein
MIALSDLRAIPTIDKSAIVLVKGAWRDRIEVAKLPGYVRLYRALRDRDNGRHAAFYVQPTDALEACAKAIGIAVPNLREKLKAARK